VLEELQNAELFHFTAAFHEYLTAVTDVIIVFYQIQIWTEKCRTLPFHSSIS